MTGDRFISGARVTNQCRLLERANRPALPTPRSPIRAEAVAIARAHPEKSWAKRYLRARGIWK